MASLEEAASVILNACMKLMKDESILIVTDKNKVKIAQVLFDEAQKITKNAVIKALNFTEVAASSEIKTKTAERRSSRFVFPKCVIRKNPAKHVPTILPIVESAYRFPTVLPVASSRCNLSLTE